MNLKAILILVVVAAVLGVTLYVVTRSEPNTPITQISRIWDFEMDDLQHIVLSMPRIGDEEKFIVHEDRYFYFDEENGSIVDVVRWGGGIPLILSGPATDRSLVKNATDAQLEAYGFTNPNLKITLTLKDSTVYNIDIGDSTPGERTYYIRLAESRDIYTIDYMWFDVISGLVTNPPYPAADFVNEKLTVTPLEASIQQPITITAEMANVGALTGQFDVILMINGIIEETQTIELGRDERTTVVFNITKSAGTYSINVAGKTAKLEVK